jgi:hypothetical protein
VRAYIEEEALGEVNCLAVRARNPNMQTLATLFWANANLLGLILLWSNLGAAVLAGTTLGLEFCVSKSWARRLPAIGVLILTIAAIVSWYCELRTPITAECILLAVFALIAWAVGLENVRHLISRALTPRLVWGIVLLFSLAGARFLAAHLVSNDEVHPATVVGSKDMPVNDVYAMTDAGRVITLFRYEMTAPAIETEACILAEKRFQNEVIRLADPSPECNCHGWVFTGGKYGVRHFDIPLILTDNGYTQVQEPQPGDVAIYVSGTQATHSGIVRYVNDDGRILIESKWGPFGVFLHPIERQPFSGACRFYRSERIGHAASLHPPQAPSKSKLTAFISSITH